MKFSTVLLEHAPRLIFALVLVGLTIAAGTAGYMLVEKWNLLDSLYMAFITISSVGFRAVRTLSPSGQLFTIVFIMAGVLYYGRCSVAGTIAGRHDSVFD